MNLKKLEVFVRAVDLCSLSKAGQELGYTQSGISHMIKSLEEEIGFALLTRSPSGIQPNREGRMLLPAIREMLAGQEALSQTIGAIRGMETGCVTVGSFSSVAMHWLPGILQQYERLHPNIQIHILEAGVDELETKLLDAQLDLCFFARGSRRGFDWLPIMEDPLMAVLPLHHPLAGAARFPVEAFCDDWFIAPTRGFDYDVHRVLDKLAHKPKVKFTSENDHTIVSLVSQGLGLSVLPELFLAGLEGKVACVLLEPGLTRELGIAVRCLKTASPACKSFIAFARAYLREELQKTGRRKPGYAR